MKFPEIGVTVCQLMYEGNQPLAHGDDDQRRMLTRRIAEQLCSVLGSRWGGKARAGHNMPLSKDAIGYLEDDGTVSVWDWQDGGSRQSRVREGSDPDYPRLPANEAQFIEVPPIDHLHIADPKPDPKPGPDVVKVDFPEVVAAIRENTAALRAMTDVLQRAFTKSGGI
jgi:hypothetical protein